MNILHLSETTLSGSPIRIVNMLNKYTDHSARHIVWVPIAAKNRVFEIDMVGSHLKSAGIRKWFDWADVIHYHNRWRRQSIFKEAKVFPPDKPSLIHMHSPIESESYRDELESGVPIAAVGQYQVRQWPTAQYILPNVVDIYDPMYMPLKNKPTHIRPMVSYAPSNVTALGWDDKGYFPTASVLKRMFLRHKIMYSLIVSRPHKEAMKMKQPADLGIDEIVTGSYHLSSLEYLSMGIACFANLDSLTEGVVKDLTGCTELPWIIANKDTFKNILETILRERSWGEMGEKSRKWMEKYWNPAELCRHYDKMYEEIANGIIKKVP